MLLQEKKLIEFHCPDFIPLDQECKVYEGRIFYKIHAKISSFKVLMEIPTDFPRNVPRFKALQDSNWEMFNGATQELLDSFFDARKFDHVYSYILFFKGEFIRFMFSNNKNRPLGSKIHKISRLNEGNDLSLIINLAKHNSRGMWINKEMLISKSRWNLNRINSALELLEGEGIARKIESRSTGTRWYFPGA